MRRFEGHIGNVLVLGLGKSGKSAARYCAALLGTRVDSLFIAAGARTAESEAFVESLADEGVRYAFGDGALEGDVGRFDLCIASPGIPFWHELYVRGAELSDEIVSEVEFAWRESDEDSTWVAITGTNGKTTTTSLAAHVLRECGFAADAVGNIGDVCLDAVAAGKTQVYVAEVSSYQLHSTRAFAPDVAVLLNITPDHIHWHQTLEAYAEAKFKVLGGTVAGAMNAPGEVASVGTLTERPRAMIDGRSVSVPTEAVLPDVETRAKAQARPLSRPFSILDATNDVVRGKVREMRAAGRDDYIPMGTADGIRGDMRAKCGATNAAFLGEGDELLVAFGGEEHALGKASDLQIKGEHNASNALAAAAVAVALGADDAAIAKALASFKPLAHRIEPCGSVAGVECYNDSKATNVDATLKALAAFPGKRVIIMLGGDDKGTDLAELVAATHAHAVAAVCYGEGGPRFYQALAELQPSADVSDNPVGAQTPAPAAEGGTHTRRPLADAPGGPVGASSSSPAAEGGTPQPSAIFTCLNAAHMEDALDAALSIAQSGDVVLLSPACASFDEFRSFEHRGDTFKQLVAARAESRGA